MKTFTGTGTFATAARWDGGTLPAAGDALVIDGACTLDANETVTYGAVTVNAGDSLDMATFNLQCGAFVCAGTHAMGVSAGTGLTCTSFTGSSGWTRTWDNASKITCSGNVSLHNTGTYTIAKGTWVQSGNATAASMMNGLSSFYSFTLNAGVTWTCAAACYITFVQSLSTTLNGTINVGASTCRVGCSVSGTFTFGANADIAGTGRFQLAVIYGATTSWAKSDALSITGYVDISGVASSNVKAFFKNFSNATYTFLGNLTAPSQLTPDSTTLYAKNFYVTATANQNITIDNSVNNPSIVISENINLKTDSYTYTLAWTKGAGTITLGCGTGSSTIDFQGQSVCAIVKTGQCTKLIASDFSTVSFSGGGGTIQSSTAGTQRTITVSNASAKMKKTRFKDIAISGGTLKVINGKNLGNNTGIKFIKRMPKYPW